MTLRDTSLAAGILLAAVCEAISGTVLSLGRNDILGDTHATPDEFAWLDVGYTSLKFIGFVSAPWLMSRSKPRNMLLATVLLLAIACALAGLSTRPEMLIVLRIVQGFAGGVILVAGQTLLFLAYPRDRQPVLQAVFAMGAVVAPATIAPALDGWLIDSQSWTWIYYSVVPVALSACGFLLMADTPAPAYTARLPFDVAGFALLATTFCCLTYVISLGSRWDWFEEPRIVWSATIGTATLLGFFAHRLLSKRRGFLDLRAFQTADFTFAFLVSFVAGAALFGSAFLISSFALSVLAFTPTDVGRLLLPSSVLFVGALLLAAFLFQYRRVPPIATVPFGIVLIIAAMWMLSGSSGESGMDDMMPAMLVRGLGLGFLFLSITLIAFGELPKRALAPGIGLFNTGRQLGGLLGVAGLQTLIDHQAVANLAVLGANLTSGMPAVGDRLTATAMLLSSKGLDASAASIASASLLGRVSVGQALTIAFDTAFNAVALLFVVAIPVLIAIKIGIGRRARRRADHASRALAVVASIVLPGCTVGPDYQPVPASAREAWIARVDVAEVDGEWWRNLRDPTLDELVVSGVTHNKDLREAAARLREVRANRDAIRGRAYPQASVSAVTTENRLSANGLLPVAKIPGFEADFPIHDLGFDASWEVDWWGGTRRAVESANARVQAAEEARRGVILQIVAEIVRSYVDLRAAQNLRANVIADAESQHELARIVADRLKVGAASEFDLTRARAQALATAAAIPGYDGDAAAAAIRLSVLAGEHPEAFYERLSVPAMFPSPDLQVKVGLRADLLRRRPDVRQAERDVAAATAEIGVATAELFPRLSLIAGFGQQARSTDDLFKDDSLRLQFGPALRWSIFSGGRIRAQIRAADARADGAIIRYERAVANALADSETAINRFTSSRRTRVARDDARREADAAVGLARQRYLSGEDDLTALLQAQSAFSAADRQSIQARAAELQQLTALYKALGGGWEVFADASSPSN